MKSLIVIFILILSLACKTNNTKNSSDNNNTEIATNEGLVSKQVNSDFNTFTEYLNAITLINPPFKYICNEDLKQTIDIDSKFRPEGSSIMGKLKSINNKNFIIYTYPADIVLPILEIYDNEGSKIKQIELLDMGYCYFEFENQFSEFIIPNDSLLIFQNFKVVNSDTIFEKTETINLREL